MALAESFVEFMLIDEIGMSILEKNSHQILIPPICTPFEAIPDFLK